MPFARLALAYAGIQCVVREILLKKKPSEILELSRKVTVLVLPGGEVIDESLDIMRGANTGHHGWLESEVATSLIERNDNHFKYHLDRYKYPQRFQPQSDAAFTDSRPSFSSPYWSNLCAEQVSIADIATFPFVRQFAAVEPEQFVSLPYPHLQGRLMRWLDSDLFVCDDSQHSLASGDYRAPALLMVRQQSMPIS